MTTMLERGIASLKERGNENVIYIHAGMGRTLRDRLNMRKVCGPYMYTPATPGSGTGFYQASHGLECGDGRISLRLREANDYLSGSRLSDITGYWTDEDGGGDGTLKPIVALLPHGRGYLAGWTMGSGMCASMDFSIHGTAEDAARAAHSMVEHDAEAEREYQAKQRAEDEEEQD